jgi:hypothetical protein
LFLCRFEASYAASSFGSAYQRARYLVVLDVEADALTADAPVARVWR